MYRKNVEDHLVHACLVLDNFVIVTTDATIIADYAAVFESNLARGISFL